jgi:putative phosphoribosyl transferase
MFADRRDAGRLLARALEQYRGAGALVLAIPRGGVEVGYEVAAHLHAELSIIVARKLPFPDEPEAGFGAVAEDGSTVLAGGARAWLSPEAIERAIAEQQAEIVRRVAVLRRGRPLPEMAGRTVILVDDGIAMGSTMRAAVQLCRKRGAGRVVVAVPVTGERTAAEMARLADEVVVLEKPPLFRAVAQVYRNWYDVSDQEVLEILER